MKTLTSDIIMSVLKRGQILIHIWYKYSRTNSLSIKFSTWCSVGRKLKSYVSTMDTNGTLNTSWYVEPDFSRWIQISNVGICVIPRGMPESILEHLHVGTFLFHPVPQHVLNDRVQWGYVVEIRLPCKLHEYLFRFLLQMVHPSILVCSSVRISCMEFASVRLDLHTRPRISAVCRHSSDEFTLVHVLLV